MKISCNVCPLFCYGFCLTFYHPETNDLFCVKWFENLNTFKLQVESNYLRKKWSSLIRENEICFSRLSWASLDLYFSPEIKILQALYDCSSNQGSVPQLKNETQDTRCHSLFPALNLVRHWIKGFCRNRSYIITGRKINYQVSDAVYNRDTCEGRCSSILK